MRVFVDTDAFVALNDPQDVLHRKAITLSKALAKRRVDLLTASNILLEATTLISQKVNHQQAVKFLDNLIDGEIPIVYVDEGLIEKGAAIFKKQTSKNVGLSDCVSAAVMQEFRVKDIFSFDKQFAKIGFKLFTGKS